jgi:hypothetical protein
VRSKTVGEQLTELWLDELKFEWERIPESEKKRADYRVTDGRDAYLIEVKQREKDNEYETALARNGQAESQEFMGRLNPISRQVKESAKQLAATPARSDAFRILAFAAAGADPEIQEQQFLSTVYGKVDLIIGMKDGVAQSKPCYYFTFSDFFRLHGIDGALVLLGNRSRFCINAFSPRLEALQQSRLYEDYDKRGATEDPTRREAAGEAFIADCGADRDRRDENAVLEYVKSKYDLSVAISFQPTHYKAAVVVPRKIPGRA